MKNYLSGRAGCLHRQAAGSWNVLDTFVRRWYYYRGSYCKATEVEERTGRRLVLRRIATLGSHLVRTIDIHAAKSLLA
jgi:hypothetical protein